MQPTDFEQAMLEMINRSRTDPEGEFDELIVNATTGEAIQANVTFAISFFNVDLDVFRSQLDGVAPAAPLAWNDALGLSADTHSQLMIDNNLQSHNLPDEPSLLQRFQDAGYDNLSTIAENIFAFSEDPVQAHAGFFIDWGITPTGIQQPPGHRNTILNPTFTEIGLSSLEENNPGTGVGPFVVTQHFGTRFNYVQQLLGVVTDDLDNDDQYDIGEGLGGVTVTAVRGSQTVTTTSWDSGGYQLELAAGTYEVTFSGGGLGGDVTRMVTIASENVKVDVETAPSTNTAPDITGISSNAVDENSPTGTVVGQLIATDGDGDTLTFSLTDDAGGLFAISGDTLVVNGPLDFETGGSHDVTVEVRDPGGETGTLTLTIEINDINEDTADPINGTAGDETLSGTALADIINGFGGDDLLAGGLGNDTLNGGDGNDNIAAAAGNDVANGDAGNDNMGGGTGDDTMDGGLGNDTLGGGQGNDSAAGGAGNDIVIGGAGNDTLGGGAGDDTMGAGFNNDSVDGGDGADSLGGGTGRDTLNGGAGDDAIGGGEGDDVVNGDDGNDFLAGGGRNDLISGGAGDDRINGGDGDDTISGGDGADLFIFNYFKDGDADVFTDYQDGVDRFRMTGVEGRGAAGKLASLNITDTADGALMTVGGHTILVENTRASAFGTEDFVFQ